MMKKAILLLLVLMGAFFAVECKPGYEETAVIQVVDGNGRVIQGAAVQIVYQVDQTTGKGYTTTTPRKTDESGTASFVFRNQEILKSRLDCEYIIIVTYDNQKLEKRIRVDTHGPVIDVGINAYLLTIKAVDQEGNVLADAEIITREISKTTGADGMVSLLVGSGAANVTLKYGNGAVSREITIENDTNFLYEVPVYELKLYVVDDGNAPLQVSANIGGTELYTDLGGFLSVKKLLSAKPTIKTEYRGVEKTLEADLAVQDTYYMVYDLRAPVIKRIAPREEEGRLVMDLEVADQGPMASGLAPDGIKVRYSIGGNNFFASVFVKDADKYEAYIGAIKEDGVIEFFVDAVDAEGNIRSLKGYFSVSHESEGANQTGSGAGGGGGGLSLDPVQIIGAGIAIVAVLVIANYIRENFGSQ